MINYSVSLRTFGGYNAFGCLVNGRMSTQSGDEDESVELEEIEESEFMRHGSLQLVRMEIYMYKILSRQLVLSLRHDLPL